VCPSLAKAVDRLFRAKDKPEVLDLGPMSGDTVVHFAGLGARVTVDEFEPPPPRSNADEDTLPEPIRIDQPDDRFDLVLGWEQVDFVPPDRLEEFIDELRRVMTEDGFLLMLSKLSNSREARSEELRGRYHTSGDSELRRVPVEDEAPRRRWSHPTRSIERAMAGFSIQGVHLQRNQVREFLAVKQTGRRAVSKTAKKSTRAATTTSATGLGDRRVGRAKPVNGRAANPATPKNRPTRRV
jgi:hypothetical protein